MADITNQHFSYSIKNPVYQPIQGLGDDFRSLGLSDAFQEFADKYKQQAALATAQPPQEPKTREQITAELTEAYPSIPAPELEVMADQRLRHQKLSRQYDDNARQRDMAFDTGMPALMDYFDKRDINLGNALRESERGLKGMDDDFKARSNDLSQKRVLYQNLLGLVNSSNFANIPEKDQPRYLAYLKNLETDLSKYPGFENVFSYGQQADTPPMQQEATGEEFDYGKFVNDLFNQKGMTRADLEFRFEELARKRGLTQNDRQHKAVMNLIANKYRDAEAAHDKKQKDADFALRQKEGQMDYANKEFTNYLNQNFPKIDNESEDIRKSISKVNDILAMYKNNKSGAGYVGLKRLLGDAINNGDFKGVLGNTGAEGFVGMLKDFIGNTQITETQAKNTINAIIASTNRSITEFNKKLEDTDEKYRDKISKAYKKETIKGIR